MPTYRYRCGSCGDELEIWQSITDDALTEHDACGGALVKVLSPAGIVLKGSGFYKTDARSGSSGNGSREPKDTSSKDTSSKDGGSTDAGSKDSGSKDAGSKDSGSKSDSAGSSGTKSDSGAKSGTSST
jgi:putative FmdB family regulatory protein